MADPAHHRLSVSLGFGAERLHAQFTLSAPWTLLFGPSGVGKSTLLRAAAGLVTGPGVRFDRRGPDDRWHTLQDARIHVPPHRRHIGWAPQQASLFPHLSVADNIRFGAAGAVFRQSLSPEAAALADTAVALFGLGNLLARRPHELSGGEAQRVNLARAVAVPGCRLLLLDEPFAGTDRAGRDAWLRPLRDWLGERGVPVLSVSHDVDEAFALEAEVLLLRDGNLVGRGAAREVLAPERARMLAALK